MKRLFAAGAFTVVLGAGSMFGAQITQTMTVAPATTDINQSAASTVTFADFLNAPGYVAGDILNSVTLSATVSQTVLTLTIKNTNASSASFRFTTAGSYDVGGTAPDQGALDTAISGFNPTLFASGLQTLMAGATYTAPTGVAPNGIGTAVSTTSGVLTAASIAPYNTTGTFTLDFSTLTSETVSGGGGNVVATETSQAGATFSVVYNYTAPTTTTPEPATMTLFGSALLGVGFFARKRIKKA